VLNIRLAAEADRDAIWNIFHDIVAAGDTYAFDPEMSREEALTYWFGAGTHTYVAELARLRRATARQAKGRVRPIGGQDRQSVGDGAAVPGKPTASPTVEVQDREVVGTYILRANQAGPGAHVANAAYMVAKDARGLGVGRRMGEHSLTEARRLGFGAMQFNFVVSTNASAIHLWQQLGFKIVGTLPGAFRHPRAGYVDVYVMFRSLL
jgi:L-amino acid N-acyltransferase YncA